MVMKIRTNIPSVQRYLKNLGDKEYERVVRNTINDIAFDGRASEIKQMHKDLDRPTPFTTSMKAYRFEKARSGKLYARVSLKERQADYLRWQVFGGTKQGGRGGVPVGPSNQRNKYGNTPGYRNFITTRKGKREEFRFIRPGDKGHPGIYKKFKTKEDRLVMSFVKKTRYRKRYSWGAGFKKYAKANVHQLFKKHARSIRRGPTR